MVKIKLEETKPIVFALREILKKELPIKPSYWFGKLAGKIGEEARLFENERMKLVDKYAAKDIDGKLKAVNDEYQFSDENKQPFTDGYKELAETEIEIDFKPININDLGDVVVKPNVIMALEKFITIP